MAIVKSEPIENAYPDELCMICKKRPFNHTIFQEEENLKVCCYCWVIELNHSPADWHKGCMEAKKEYLNVR